MPTGVYIRTDFHRKKQKEVYQKRFLRGERMGFKKGQISWNKNKSAPWAKNLPQRFKKGCIPWNKGKKQKMPEMPKCPVCGITLKSKKSKNCAKHFSITHRKKLSKNNCPFWKGGITQINQQIRTSFDFKQWRKSVFEYDNYTCWICETMGIKLHAHHLMNFSKYPKLRFAKKNGITLCEFCHKIYTKYGYKSICRDKLTGRFLKQ
jgi:hypothetical protein